MESEQKRSGFLRTNCIYLCFCLLIISLIVIIFYDEIYETLTESSPIVYTFSAIATFCFSYIALNSSGVKNKKGVVSGRLEKDGGFLEEKEFFEYSRKDIENELNLLKTENKEIEELMDEYDGFEGSGKKLEELSNEEIRTELEDLLANARSTFVPYGIRKKYVEKINIIVSKSKTLRKQIGTKPSWSPKKNVINYKFIQDIKAGKDNTKERLFIEEYILKGELPSDVASVINDLHQNKFLFTGLEILLLKLLYSFLPFYQTEKSRKLCGDSYVDDVIANTSSSKNYREILKEHSSIIQYLEDITVKDQADFMGIMPLFTLENCNSKAGSCEEQLSIKEEKLFDKLMTIDFRKLTEEQKETRIKLRKRKKLCERKKNHDSWKKVVVPHGVKSTTEWTDSQRRQEEEYISNQQLKPVDLSDMINHESNKEKEVQPSKWHCDARLSKDEKDLFDHLMKVDFYELTDKQKNIRTNLRKRKDECRTLAIIRSHQNPSEDYTRSEEDWGELIRNQTQLEKDQARKEDDYYMNHSLLPTDPKDIAEEFNKIQEDDSLQFDTDNGGDGAAPGESIPSYIPSIPIDRQNTQTTDPMWKGTANNISLQAESKQTITETTHNFWYSDDKSKTSGGSKGTTPREAKPGRSIPYHQESPVNTPRTAEPKRSRNQAKNMTQSSKPTKSPVNKDESKESLNSESKDEHVAESKESVGTVTLSQDQVLEQLNSDSNKILNDRDQQISSSGYKQNPYIDYNTCRNLDLRTKPINFLNAIPDTNNAFISTLIKNNYSGFLLGDSKDADRPRGIFNVYRKLNDIHLRLVVHYYTNRLRISELEKMDNSCINKISKAGVRIKEMQVEIAQMKEDAKQIEKIKVLEEDLENLEEQKAELALKVSSLENDKRVLVSKVDTLEKDKTKTLKINKLEADLESERRELEREIQKTTLLTQQKQEIVLKLAELEQINTSLDEKVSEIPKLERINQKLEDELSVLKEETKKKEDKITELTDEYTKEIEVVRKASAEKSKTIRELQEESKEKDDEIAVMKDKISDMEYDIKICNRQKDAMTAVEQFSNILASKLRNMDRQVISIERNIHTVADKYNKYIIKKDKKLKEVIKSTNYSIDLIRNGFERIDRTTKRVENAIQMFSKYRDNRKETERMSNYQIDKANRYIQEMRKNLEPFFITNGAGFHYMKEHIRDQYRKRTEILKALQRVEFEDTVRYTKQDNLEYFEKELNKKNNKVYAQERVNLYRKLFDIDKELHYQIKIVQRFNSLVDSIFKEYKPIDLNLFMTDKTEMEVTHTNTGILAEYSFLIDKYSEYIHDYNKIVQKNTTLEAKNKLLEEKLTFVRRQNDILQSATSPGKSNSATIDLLKEEIARLNKEVDEFFRNNSGSLQDMKEHEISMAKMTKNINARNLQIAKLKEAIDALEKNRLVEIEKTIDSSYQEFHKELDDIIEVLGLQKSMQTPVEYGNVDMGNIKKKQMAIITRVRELIISEDYKKEAGEEIEKLKKEAGEMKDIIKSKEIIIEELKSALKSGTNLLDETVSNNTSKDLIKTHTELLNEEKQKLQKQLEELETDRTDILNDFNALKKKYDNEQEKERVEDNNLISFANKIAKVSTFLVTPVQYYSDELVTELLTCVSSRGVKRMFIHFFINGFFTEKGKRILFREMSKQTKDELWLDSVFLEKDILTKEGLDTLMGYLEMDSNNSYISFFSKNLDRYLIQKSKESGPIENKKGDAEKDDTEWASENEDDVKNKDDMYDNSDIIPSSENLEIVKIEKEDIVSYQNDDRDAGIDDDLDVLLMILLYEFGFINKTSDLFKEYYSNAIFSRHNNGSSFNDMEFLKDCIENSLQYNDNFYRLIRNINNTSSKLVKRIDKEFGSLNVYTKDNNVKNYNAILSFTKYYFPDCKFMTVRALTNLLIKNDNEFGVDMDWLDSILVMIIKDAYTFKATESQINEVRQSIDRYDKEIKYIQTLVSNDISKKLVDTESYITRKLASMRHIAFNIDPREFSKNQKLLREISNQKKSSNSEELLVKEKETQRLIYNMSKELIAAMDEFKKRPEYKRREKNGNPMSRGELEAAAVVNKIISMINKLKEESKDIISERDAAFEIFYDKLTEVATKLGDYTFSIQEELSNIDELIRIGNRKNQEIKALKAKISELEASKEDSRKLEKALTGHTETSIKIEDNLNRLSDRIASLNKQKEELSRQSSLIFEEKKSRESSIDEYKVYIDGIEKHIAQLNERTKRNNSVNKDFHLVVKRLSEQIQNVVDKDMNTDLYEKLTNINNRVLSSLDEKKELAEQVAELRQSKENIVNAINELLNGLSSNTLSGESLNSTGAGREEIIKFTEHWKAVVEIIESSKSQQQVYEIIDTIYEKLSEQGDESLYRTKMVLLSLDNKVMKVTALTEMIDKLQILAKRQEELVVKDKLIQDLEKSITEKEEIQKKLDTDIEAYNKLQAEIIQINSNLKSIESNIARYQRDAYDLETKLEDIEGYITNIKHKLAAIEKESKDLSNTVSYQNSSISKISSELEQNNKSIIYLIDKVTEYQKKSNKLIYPEELDRQISKYVDMSIDYFNNYDIDIKYISQLMTSIENRWKSGVSTISEYASKNKKLESEVERLSKELAVASSKNCDSEIKELEDTKAKLKALELILSIFSSPVGSDIEIISKLKDNSSFSINSSNLIDYLISKREKSKEIINILNKSFSEWEELKDIISKLGMEEKIQTIIDIYTNYKNETDKLIEQGQKTAEDLESTKTILEETLLSKKQLKERISKLEEEKISIENYINTTATSNIDEVASRIISEDKEIQYLLKVIDVIDSTSKKYIGESRDIQIQVEDIIKNSNTVKDKITSSTYTVSQIYPIIIKSIDEIKTNILEKAKKQYAEESRIEIENIHKAYEIKIKSIEDKLDEYNARLTQYEFINKDLEKIRSYMEGEIKRQKESTETRIKDLEESLKTAMSEKQKLSARIEQLLSINNLTDKTIESIRELLQSNNTEITNIVFRLGNIIEYTANLRKEYDLKLDALAGSAKISDEEKEQAVEEYNQIFNLMEDTMSAMSDILGDVEDEEDSFVKSRAIVLSMSQLNTKLVDYKKLVDSSIMSIDKLQETAMNSIDYIYESSRIINQLSVFLDSINSKVFKKINNIVDREKEIIQMLNNNELTELNAFINKKVSNTMLKEAFKNKMLTLEVNKLKQDISSILKNINNNQVIVNQQHSKPKEIIKYITVVEEVYIPMPVEDTASKPVVKKNKSSKSENQYSEYDKYIKTLKKTST